MVAHSTTSSTSRADVSGVIGTLSQCGAYVLKLATIAWKPTSSSVVAVAVPRGGLPHHLKKARSDSCGVSAAFTSPGLIVADGEERGVLGA